MRRPGRPSCGGKRKPWSSADVTQDLRQLQHQQAETLIRVTSTDAPHDLAQTGLLPESVAQRTAKSVETEIDSA